MVVQEPMGLLLVGDILRSLAAVSLRGIRTYVELAVTDRVRAVLAAVLARVARLRREPVVLLKQLPAHVLRQLHGIPSLVVVRYGSFSAYGYVHAADRPLNERGRCALHRFSCSATCHFKGMVFCT